MFLVVTMFGELTLFLGAAAVSGRARPDVPHLDGLLVTAPITVEGLDHLIIEAEAA